MDRSFPTHWQSASFEPTRAPHPPRRHSIASYQPVLPSESRMPDEWGYPSSSMSHVSNIPRNIQGAAAPTTPTCRYLNCHRPVTRDERTHELTEYCSPEHMRDAVQRLGYPVCPACNRCPRRTDRKFCGSLCEEWAMQQQQQRQRQQQNLHQQQLQSQQRQQQVHYQRQQQQRQHWQLPTMGPPPTVPNPGVVIAARGSIFPKNGIWKQVRFQQ